MTAPIMGCPLCKQIVAKRRNGKPTRHLRPGSTVEFCRGFVRQSKGWSVRDADHIPDGERVMIRIDLVGHLAEFRKVLAMLGGDIGRVAPYGTVKHRQHGSGRYMLAMEGDANARRLSSAFTRDQLLWPIPEGVVAFDREARTRRLRRVA